MNCQDVRTRLQHPDCGADDLLSPDIQVHVEQVDFVSIDAEMWWQQISRSVQAYFKRVREPDILERFKEQVFLDLQAFQSPQGVRFRKTVSFAFGNKPR